MKIEGNNISQPPTIKKLKKEAEICENYLEGKSLPHSQKGQNRERCYKIIRAPTLKKKLDKGRVSCSESNAAILVDVVQGLGEPN